MASVFKRGGKSNRGGYWYVGWFDHNGKRRTKCTRTTDKAAADRIAAKYDADSALRREGVIDPHLDATAAESKRTIEAHLADYEAKMKTAGRNAGHVADTLAMVRTVCEAAGFKLAGDMTADGVNLYAVTLLEKGRAARTIQSHLTAMKGFTKWLALQHKLPRDPLAEVSKPNPETDRRKERRMLLPEEWQWLKSATITAGESFGVKPVERLLLYQIAIETGLRSSELRSLTRGQLYLGGQRAYVTCKARSTKNKQDARQYINDALAGDLRRHAATKTPQAQLFAMPHETQVAKMLRADLAHARREWMKAAKGDAEEYQRREQSDFLSPVNHDKQTLDFHALRHTCGAWLAISGVHPKMVQTVMRHSSIKLTFDTYGHLFPGQEADAVSKMGGMLCGGDGSHEIRATGTDGGGEAQRQAQQLGRESIQISAGVCENEEPAEESAAGPNILRLAALEDVVQVSADQSESSLCETLFVTILSLRKVRSRYSTTVCRFRVPFGLPSAVATLFVNEGRPVNRRANARPRQKNGAYPHRIAIESGDPLAAEQCYLWSTMSCAAFSISSRSTSCPTTSTR